MYYREPGQSSLVPTGCIPSSKLDLVPHLILGNYRVYYREPGHAVTTGENKENEILPIDVSCNSTIVTAMSSHIFSAYLHNGIQYDHANNIIQLGGGVKHASS